MYHGFVKSACKLCPCLDCLHHLLSGCSLGYFLPNQNHYLMLPTKLLFVEIYLYFNHLQFVQCYIVNRGNNCHVLLVSVAVVIAQQMDIDGEIFGLCLGFHLEKIPLVLLAMWKESDLKWDHVWVLLYMCSSEFYYLVIFTVRLIQICMFLIICINNVLFSGKLSLFLGHRDIETSTPDQTHLYEFCWKI